MYSPLGGWVQPSYVCLGATLPLIGIGPLGPGARGPVMLFNDVGPFGLAGVKPFKFAPAGFEGTFGLRIGFFRGLRGSAALGLRVNCGAPPLLGVGVGVPPFDMPDGEADILNR